VDGKDAKSARVAIVAVCLLVGFGGGFTYQRYLGGGIGSSVSGSSSPKPADDKEPSSSGRASWRGVQTPYPAIPDGDDEQLHTRIGQLNEEIAQVEALNRTYETELNGSPHPWPDDLPEKLTPAGFEAQVTAAIEECGVEVDLVGFDCEEFPCLLALRDGEENWWSKLTTSCQAWVDSYGVGASGSMGVWVDCGDGRREEFGVIMANVDGLLDLDDEASDELVPDPKSRLSAPALPIPLLLLTQQAGIKSVSA